MNSILLLPFASLLRPKWWEQGFLRDHSPEVLRGDADSGGNLFPFSPEDEPARETHMLIK